ncbi:hypothetical protein JOQ06_011125, partial [Pogonophryne albipinna]
VRGHVSEGGNVVNVILLRLRCVFRLFELLQRRSMRSARRCGYTTRRQLREAPAERRLCQNLCADT